MKQKRIALLMLGVSSTACGGAERFFPDFFRKYQQSAEAQHQLFFFTDPGTLEVLKKLGKISSEKNIVVLKNVSNRFKRNIENADILRQLLAHRIDIIHVANYGTNYFDRLKFVSRLPSFIRPRVVINIVDCEIPYVLSDSHSPKYSGYTRRYMPLFKSIRPDGVFTWYELFCRFAREKKLVGDGALLEAARTRFADTTGFMPAPVKEKQIIYAARLTPQKQPLMFAEAIRLVHDRNPALLEGWNVFVYGSGPMENELSAFIARNNLGGIVSQHPSCDLKPLLAKSSCYVSTQDFENFPSLAMNEAMAAGNAIVSRNVGQTALFVEDGKNGFLAATDDAAGVAAALEKFLSDPSRHPALMQHSLYLAREVHTPVNFIRQIDEFWNKF